MTKVTYIIVLYTFIFLLLTGCDGSMEGQFYRVQRVYDDASVQLDNGTVVNLIGIKGSKQSREYLDKHVVGSDVKLVFDNSNREKQKDETKKIAAYILIGDLEQEILPCANSEILMLKLSELYQGTYLRDSLEIYKKYADDWITYPPAENAERKKIPTEELIKMIEPAVFMVICYNAAGQAISQGSGFFISQTQGITNYHVIKGAAKNNVDENTAIELFDLIEKFSGYGFNKSHAACYSMIAYQTAYMKTYYPTEFMVALMVSDEEDMDRIKMEINEAATK